ncbi:MAG: SPOR domain-containing protein [Patescibacteria group bacterium]
MEKKGLQVIKDVASKTAGLVFFSLLAIALGVVFGVMFERWVGGEGGTPASTEGIEAPIDEMTAQVEEPFVEPVESGTQAAQAPAPAAVKFRVKVGPYSDYAQAAKAADELRGQGYPIFLAAKAPYLVQVGAFANKDNALSLKAELTKKGYTVAVQPE